ncbi:MAG TPA: shikimate dehydrogenase [Solirubrobacterales bacterium]|jgi:shikimate dehydrogenase|nr:shikimate dehydrogenase [Solirubrobacterales bacterium]
MSRLAVLGHPVAHSRSPAMQNAALAALGLEEWSYEAIDVAPEGFEERVRAMAAEGFAGANVTVPHKHAALALADAPSEVAGEIGAANTLSFGTGEIVADNTDAGGLLAALPEPAAGRRALVLGAGGAARGVVWALEREGATVEVWNRTAARAERLCAELGGTAIGGADDDDAAAGAPAMIPDQSAYDLIVNTSMAGLKGEDPFAVLPLSRDGFGSDQTVVDMVYGETPSPLLVAAADAGAVVVDGLEILVQQGALSLRIWTGREAPLEVMRIAARA